MLKSAVLCLLLWHETCQFFSHAHPGSTDTRVPNFPPFVSPKINHTDVQIEPRLIYNFNITSMPIFYINGPVFVISGSDPNFNGTDNVSRTGLSRSEGNRRLEGASPQARSSQSETTTSTTYRWVPEGYLVTEGIGAYKVHREKKKWSDARQICIAEGGDLAVIRSMSEQNILAKMMKDTGVRRPWIGNPSQLGKENWTSPSDEPLENGPGHLPSAFHCCCENYTMPLCVALHSIDEMRITCLSCSKPKSFVCKIATI